MVFLVYQLNVIMIIILSDFLFSLFYCVRKDRECDRLVIPVLIR